MGDIVSILSLIIDIIGLLLDVARDKKQAATTTDSDGDVTE